MAITTIRPAKNTRKFYSTAKQFQKVTGKDAQGKPTSTVQEAGEYKGQRFPNSRQMIRPLWSTGKRKYILQGHDKNSKELNKIVAGCKLRYPKKHPKAGEYITEADILDFSDPFFTHTKLYMILKEGDESLDDERPFDQIMLAAMSGDRRFSNSDEKNPYLAGKVKFKITNSKREKAAKNDKRKKEFELMSLFKALSRKKKLRIATALRINIGRDVEEDTLDDLIWGAAKDSNKSFDDKVTRQDMFIKLCKMNTEDLNIMYLIGRAVKKNTVRKSKEGFMLFGQNIGRTTKKIEAYLKDPANQDMLMRLEEAITELD